MNLTTELLTAINAHAKRCYPQECCGLIIKIGTDLCYHSCLNIDPFPYQQFTIHPSDYAEAEDFGEIMMIVHSHVNQSAQPSEADRLGCEQSGLPWLIVGVPSGECVTLRPSGFKAELIRRSFAWGIFDCFTLIRDYYRDVLAIEFPPHEPYPYNFWKQGLDLYGRFEQFGFVQVIDEPPQAHDVFLIQIKSDIANHAAIYLGEGQMLHHLEKQLSRRDIYGGFWQAHTLFTVRHRNFV